MSGPADRLARLQSVAALVRDRDLERLRDAMKKRRSLEEDADRLRRPSGQADPASPAAIAGAHALWQDWRQFRLRSLNEQAARAAAEAEMHRSEARRSFGRAEVLALLAKSGHFRR